MSLISGTYWRIITDQGSFRGVALMIFNSSQSPITTGMIVSSFEAFQIASSNNRHSKQTVNIGQDLLKPSGAFLSHVHHVIFTGMGLRIYCSFRNEWGTIQMMIIDQIIFIGRSAFALNKMAEKRARGYIQDCFIRSAKWS